MLRRLQILRASALSRPSAFSTAATPRERSHSSLRHASHAPNKASRKRQAAAQRQAAINRAHLRSAVQSFAAAREASIRNGPAAAAPLQLPLLPHNSEPAAVYQSLYLSDVDECNSRRVRQHANPFKPDLQQLPDPVEWGTVFRDPSKPLIVDIGSASGRFILALARDSGLDCNYLGLDIRKSLTQRANIFAETLKVNDCVHFRYANATVSFERLLSTYPGSLELAAIQCPDPQFKARHHKRRIVQPNLVQAISQRLSPTGYVYLSSDVHDVAVDMRRQFETHAGDVLQVSPLHAQLLTFDTREEEEERRKQQDELSQQQQARPEPEQSPSMWVHKHWLAVNPLGLPTERELSVLARNLPMFRLLLQTRN